MLSQSMTPASSSRGRLNWFQGAKGVVALPRNLVVSRSGQGSREAPGPSVPCQFALSGSGPALSYRSGGYRRTYLGDDLFIAPRCVERANPITLHTTDGQHDLVAARVARGVEVANPLNRCCPQVATPCRRRIVWTRRI